MPAPEVTDPMPAHASQMKSFSTASAPHAIGPYSQAVSAGGFLFTSGQIALDPATGQLVEGDFRVQAERVMKNLEAVLSASGVGFSDVVRATVYLSDLADFAAFNDVYGSFMGEHKPARSTVQVAALPRGSAVEVDLIAACAR